MPRRHATRRAPARPARPTARADAGNARAGGAAVVPLPMPLRITGVTDESLLAMLGENPTPAALKLAQRAQRVIDRPRTGAAAAAKRTKRKDRDLYETPPATCDAIVARLATILLRPTEPAPHVRGEHHLDGECCYCGADASGWQDNPAARCHVNATPRKWRIIEPSAGSGHFVRALRQNLTFRESVILAVDLFPTNTLSLHRAGATSYVTGRWQEQNAVAFGPDLIVGNPPFSEAEEHVAHALAQLRQGGILAFLLPVTFIAGQRRHRGLYATPGLRYVAVVPERPSYTGDGNTMPTEYALFVWEKGYAGRPHLLMGSDAIWRAA